MSVEFFLVGKRPIAAAASEDPGDLMMDVHVATDRLMSSNLGVT